MKSGRIPSQTTTTMCSAWPAAKVVVEKRKLRTIEMMGRMPASVFKPGRPGSNENRRKMGLIETILTEGQESGRPFFGFAARHKPDIIFSQFVTHLSLSALKAA